MNPIRLVPLAALFCLGLLCGACSQTDREETGETTLSPYPPVVYAYGYTVHIDKRPERIISLAPNITEIIYFLGAEARLIARTDYCDYPPAAAELPSIGTLGSYNHERIIAMKPDLILMMTFDGSSKSEYDRLKSLGLRPFALAEGPLENVINGIDTIAMVLGVEGTGREKSDSLRDIINDIREKGARLAPVSTFVVIDKSPLMTTSGGFIGSVIEAAGGVNIAAGDPIPYPVYSRELLLRQNPEAILVPAASDTIIRELLHLYPEWHELQAVQNNRVLTIPHNLIARPGPRIVEGLQRVFRLLH